MSNLLPIIENSFTQYSAAVIQSRALVDARDGLKPSARQIFYSMLLRKLTPDKPYKKTVALQIENEYSSRNRLRSVLAQRY